MTDKRVDPNNTYDRNDMIKREGFIIAGPMKVACYRVRDPETLEWSKRQFHMVFDNTVMAVMGEEGAKLFSRFVTSSLENVGEKVSPQTAWLIEWPASDNAAPRWWHPEKGWVLNALEAAWFVREGDAEAYKKSMRFGMHLIITEHMFG